MPAKLSFQLKLAQHFKLLVGQYGRTKQCSPCLRNYQCRLSGSWSCKFARRNRGQPSCSLQPIIRRGAACPRFPPVSACPRKPGSICKESQRRRILKKRLGAATPSLLKLGSTQSRKSCGTRMYGTPGRNRTCDTSFRKAVLYPLSYRGKCYNL